MKFANEEIASFAYSAKNVSKPINFYCSAPKAESVFLAKGYELDGATTKSLKGDYICNSRFFTLLWESPPC